MDKNVIQALEEVNEEFFGIVLGGRTRFCRDELPLRPMLKETFKDVLATRTVAVERTNQDGSKSVAHKPVYDLWIKWSGRRFYQLGVALDPTQQGHTRDVYNLWQGFAVEPAPGDWSLMRQHVLEVLAAGCEEHAEYILNWTAWALQNPGLVARVALVFRGGQGTGKSMYVKQLVDVFGSHGLRVTNMQQATGRFNGHLQHLCLLFADEAVVPRSEDYGNLKAMITETDRPYEAKGVDITAGDNHLKVVLATNSKWAVPAEEDERRFAVFDVSEHRARDSDYFDALWAQMDQGGREAMLHDLLKRDISGWHPQPAPRTEALVAQKMLSLTPEDQWLLGVLEEGVLPGRTPDNSRVPEWTVLSNTQYRDGILQRMRESSPGLRDKSDQRLTGFLKRTVGAEQWTSGGVRGWTLPPLKRLRENWEARFGAHDWTDQAEWNSDEGADDPVPALPERWST